MHQRHQLSQQLTWAQGSHHPAEALPMSLGGLVVAVGAAPASGQLALSLLQLLLQSPFCYSGHGATTHSWCCLEQATSEPLDGKTQNKRRDG